ncbi:MAG TPA: DinB family protein [Candidatus Eremiobacteraceae bacterium]|nr:DinB family protein [Candidatus Eremiobacteraceae bacterium]
MHGTTVAFPKYDFYSTAELLKAYSTGPMRLAEALCGLTDEDLRARARGPEKWSIQEIVFHVSDSEILGAFRVRQAWAEPGTMFSISSYSRDIWTRELAHQLADVNARAVSLTLFALLRRATEPFFVRAQEADWERCGGKHPQFGLLTLRNLLELYADHSERHIEEILNIRQILGKPLQVPLLLPMRLFLREDEMETNLSGPQPDVLFCPRCKSDLRNVARDEMRSKGYKRKDGTVFTRHAHLRMPELQAPL